MLNLGQYAITPADCPCREELAPFARELPDGRFVVSVTPAMPHNDSWQYLSHAEVLAMLPVEDDHEQV